MIPLQLTVNGRSIAETIEPRMHLADLLREKLYLTATHLRCEQGVCGACTVLMDGEPARSCITYAVMCEQAEITTLEGLEYDPAIAALRRAFSAEHALQCGYCTPGMLITARDIVLRLPEAEESRIRTELSGNLCRCTGYEGIVRAIARVLSERRAGTLAVAPPASRQLGPVGSRRIAVFPAPTARTAAAAPDAARGAALAELGLGARQPNFEIRRSLRVQRSADEVWMFVGQIEHVVPCVPGATLVGAPEDGRIRARVAVKLGPIVTEFSGEAQLTRDETRRRGTLSGAGRDRISGSRAAAELEYQVLPAENGASRVEIAIRALLSGVLAQFGRSGIVEDLVAQMTDTFAHNVEQALAGTVADAEPRGAAPVRVGSLMWSVLKARFRTAVGRITGRIRS